MEKPIFTDRATATRPNAQYARLCIEVEAKEGFPGLIHARAGANVEEILVIYEWKPLPYSECCTFGHLAKDRPSKSQEVKAGPTSSGSGGTKDGGYFFTQRVGFG